MNRARCALERWPLVPLVSLLAATASAAAPRPAPPPPRLIVLISIDQLRYDYLARLGRHFHGGLKRLIDSGVSFSAAYHDHAITSTAPGHTALVTGTYPSRSGVIDNEWYDRAARKKLYCVEDPSSPILDLETDPPAPRDAPASAGRSPKNVQVTALPDWLKQANPGSRAFAVGGKDRTAVLMGGKHPDGVYWYDAELGRFVTSRYYGSVYPSWALAASAETAAKNLYGSAWTALPVAPETARDFGVLALDTGVLRRGFPHALGDIGFTPQKTFYTQVGTSPLVDAATVHFALALIAGEGLGKDDAVDYLGLGLSGLDYVGHDYGPNSAEALDALLRLDAILGDLFAALDREVGADKLVIALSSDHGVLPLPELAAAAPAGAHRFDVDDLLCFQGAERALEAKLGKERWLRHELYLDYDTLGRANRRRDEVEQALKSVLEACSVVAKAWTRTELEAAAAEPAGAPTGDVRQLFVNSFSKARSADVLLQLREGVLDKLESGTAHGSPYEYDTHVPMIVVFPGARARGVSERVRTVDLAPTLAALAGIAPPAGLDGVDRSALVDPRRVPSSGRK